MYDIPLTDVRQGTGHFNKVDQHCIGVLEQVCGHCARC